MPRASRRRRVWQRWRPPARYLRRQHSHRRRPPARGWRVPRRSTRSPGRRRVRPGKRRRRSASRAVSGVAPVRVRTTRARVRRACRGSASWSTRRPSDRRAPAVRRVPVRCRACRERSVPRSARTAGTAPRPCPQRRVRRGLPRSDETSTRAARGGRTSGDSRTTRCTSRSRGCCRRPPRTAAGRCSRRRSCRRATRTTTARDEVGSPA